MKKNLFLKISLFVLSFVIVAGLNSAIFEINKAGADNGDDPELYGLDESAGSLKTSEEEGIPTILGNVVGAALSFVGVLFLLLMIYGGVLWMTAQGNEQQVEKARNLIISAIIGLIIVLGAYAITSFIGGQLTS